LVIGERAKDVKHIFFVHAGQNLRGIHWRLGGGAGGKETSGFFILLPAEFDKDKLKIPGESVESEVFNQGNWIAGEEQAA
jgi:hypothetical protein